MRCPVDADETAEAYAFGTLVRADALAFEEHLLTRGQCRALVETADQHVRGMHNAARRLRGNGSNDRYR